MTYRSPSRSEAVVVVGAAAAVWAAGGWMSREVGVGPDVPVWYPPAGLALALPLIYGVPGTALALVLAVATAVGLPMAFGEGAAGLGHRVSTAVVGVMVYALAAWYLSERLHIDRRLVGQRDVILLLVAGAVLAPIPIALVAGLTAGAGDLGTVWGTVSNWSAHVTGVAMTAPVTLLLADRPCRPRGHVYGATPRGVTWLEYGSTLGMAVAAVYLSFTELPAALNPLVLSYGYLIFVPVLLAGVRHGFRRVAWMVVAINVGAVTLRIIALGDVPRGTEGVQLQFTLMAVTLVGLVLAAVVSQQRANADELRHGALHDELTGLPNRRLLTDSIEQALARVQRGQSRLTLMFVDLDRFKLYNDGFGHDFGDKVLVAVARRLESLVRPSDSVARIGGDEYVVVAETSGGVIDAEAFADRLRGRLREPIEVEGQTVSVDASVGVVPVDPSDLDRDEWEQGRRAAPIGEDLLADASTAVNEAKAAGRGRVAAFSTRMKTSVIDSVELSRDLGVTVERGGIGVALQPIIDLTEAHPEPGAENGNDDPTLRFEALARWSHPVRGQISPEVFIALAEQRGLIHDLGTGVLDTALEELSSMRQAGVWPVVMSVNVSPLQLTRTDFASSVLAMLRDREIPPQALQVELTESAVLGRSDVVSSQIQELTEAGVALAIDDFGSGYATFSHLGEVPASGLKLDFDLVRQLPGARQHAIVTESVIGMGHRLGLTITAEGVEHPGQLQWLRRVGVDQVQGYLIGRPRLLGDLPDHYLDARALRARGDIGTGD